MELSRKNYVVSDQQVLEHPSQADSITEHVYQTGNHEDTKPHDMSTEAVEEENNPGYTSFDFNAVSGMPQQMPYHASPKSNTVSRGEQVCFTQSPSLLIPARPVLFQVVSVD